jgi:pSer/pThr/pTyr-binding forkhead associated (FHA) protein
MTVLLTISYQYKGNEKTKSFDTDEITIGRKRDTIPDLDLAPDLKVSRPHARLHYDLSTWWVEDLGSAWGTLHQGKKITEPTPLQPGDELRLGDTVLRLEFEVAAPETILPDAGAVDSQFTVEEAQPPEGFSESQRLEMLARTQTIARQQVGQAMLDSIIQDMLKTFLKAERASIVLHQDKELIPVAFTPVDKAHVSFTLARRAITTRQAFRWERTAASSSSKQVSSLHDTVSALYAPIILNRRVHGVLHVDTTCAGDNFTPEELDRLVEIATMVGRSIITGAEDVLRTIPAVFISYSHKDMTFVQGLGRDLRRDPISVWFDDRLRAGKDWRAQLENAVQTFDAFVLVLSPESVASPYVRWEIDWAKGAGKAIIPLMYRTCEPPDDLKHIQYINIGANYAEGLASLIEEICAYV